MNGLPESWLAITLGEVIDYANNTTVQPKDMEPSALLVELEDIERDTSKLTDRKTVAARNPKGSKNRFLEGQILYGKLRPYLNKIIRADQDGYCSSEIIAISPGMLDRDYLFYALKSPSFLEYVNESSHGMGMPRLGTQQAKLAPFVLAPLREQTRIAQKLDELLAQVDTLKAQIEAIPKLLKRLRKSILTSAVSGKLTEVWRNKNPELLENTNESKTRCSAPAYVEHQIDIDDENSTITLPVSWTVKNVKEFCQVISGFAFSSSDFIEKGTPAVKISNIQYGKFEEKNQEYLPREFIDQHPHYIVNPKDLLMALTRPITNNTLKVCRYPETLKPALLNQRVCKFKFKNSDHTNFFELLFQSEYFKIQVIAHLSETLQPNLSPKDLSNFRVGVPTNLEQTEIVRRVEQLFAFADNLEAKVAAAKSRIDNLTQSILAKAFRGELVPQDPNDEPASVLLERIKAQRAAAPKAKRGRKTSV